MLKGALEELSTLAELGDLEAIIVRELVLGALHDGVGDLRRGQQVDLEQLGLQRRVLLAVAARLQVLEQDRRRVLDVARVHEQVHRLVHVQLRAVAIKYSSQCDRADTRHKPWVRPRGG